MEALASSLASQCAAESHQEAADAARKAQPQMAKASLSSLEAGMGSLSLPTHSVALAAFLAAKLHHLSVANKQAILLQTKEFTESVDSEVMRTHAPDLYGDVYNRLAQGLVKAKAAGEGVEVLLAGLRGIQKSPGELTSLHADFLLLCLVSRNLSAALPVLEVDIWVVMEWGKRGGAFPAKAYLLYFYYGGLVLAALRRYAQAQHFLELALSTPATAVSAIMLEAYKAYVLVSLIVEGRVGTLPKYVSPVVQRYIRPASQPYHDLAQAYQNGDPDQVEMVMGKHWSESKDAMLGGLVGRVLESLYKRNIQRLTRTFLTLSLQDVAQRAKLSGGATAAEAYLKEMIAEGSIFARISSEEGMVYFHDDPNPRASLADAAQLEAQLEEATRLAALVQRLDNETLTNPVYVQRIGKGAAGTGPGGSLAGPGGLVEGLGFGEDEGVSVSVPPIPGLSGGGGMADLGGPSFAPHF